MNLTKLSKKGLISLCYSLNSKKMSTRYFQILPLYEIGLNLTEISYDYCGQPADAVKQFKKNKFLMCTRCTHKFIFTNQD